MVLSRRLRPEQAFSKVSVSIYLSMRHNTKKTDFIHVIETPTESQLTYVLIRADHNDQYERSVTQNTLTPTM